MADYKKTAFRPADILIPQDVDMTLWSVVACDQYTSQPDYWQSVEKKVGDAPSALKIVFPEIYLGKDNSERIKKINKNMKEYMPLFKEYKNSFVYVERTIGGGKIRRGIVGAVDLECYDFSPKTDALIRATEGTVKERIPPRVEIRRDAPLESPHVMLLIDDKDCNVIEKINKSDLEMIYDFDLMQESGHISGYLVSETDEICEKLEKLADAQGENPLLFAVGDGNHSLATAKTCWENVKKNLPESEWESCPARYALVEVVNIHDESMCFEPIYRLVKGVEPKKVVDAFLKAEPSAFIGKGEGQSFGIVYGNEEITVTVKEPSNMLAVGTVQNFLDRFVPENGAAIDYIHGEDVIRKLSSEDNCVGFILPTVSKSDFFPAVRKDGALPRKTFSVGEAFEKRFYLECRKIK